MRFFVGLHKPWHAQHVGQAFISVHALERRRSAFPAAQWIMDSGAFTTIAKHGGYPQPVEAYAEQIARWRGNGELLAAVSQDFMCERVMLERTGLTVAEHQRLTIERYDALRAHQAELGVYIMPVLQGYSPAEYLAHIDQYGSRLEPGAWVGVGSVCKRNGSPMSVWMVLDAIHARRPDLRLHGFGVKTTSLSYRWLRDALYSSDSMAWSFAARKQGRNPNDWREAVAFRDRIEAGADPQEAMAW